MLGKDLTKDTKTAVYFASVYSFVSGCSFVAALIGWQLKGEFDFVYGVVAPVTFFCTAWFGVNRLVPNWKSIEFGQQYDKKRGKTSNFSSDAEGDAVTEELLREDIRNLKKELAVFTSRKNPWKDSLAPICMTIKMVVEQGNEDSTYKVTFLDFKKEVNASSEEGNILDYV
ncbi:hypothetical protein [Halodesulfovibrio sp.]|jgi:hypothetical protein|uniref:hypothetical protein n=1 Tax=Halodesulfovibrio sp. TaxID=1912772 RepID=UPI0025FF6BAB|nr:hypothetical protein [Halodesulfovibrio sp.]MCT4535998.1 hypothetical protein [Halodesulfovibrio sp.]